ncbi:hypothetical protein Ana3638_20320 [Anaerocolumna sedimenticola]|uniref:Uncharacterized protein n=1 Tax=Anaerocolumna sedimenticola TaxID=2696063 RepID=A0A6P1TTS3_9FIRM|nr:hypothetical protein [Anaerocolumna sedimenticola]QHQ62835.1 hypothetical protein Ana3638_20320 [Anaerocolumna sedimenticola]
MDNFKDNKGTPTKRTGSKNKTSLDNNLYSKFDENDISDSDNLSSIVNEIEYSEETDF